jgi:SPOR domain
MNDKQTPRAPIDLDEFERQLRAMQTQPRLDMPDPLAELARIVGQDDPHMIEKNATPVRDTRVTPKPASHSHAASIFDELSNLRDQRLNATSNKTASNNLDADQGMFELDTPRIQGEKPHDFHDELHFHDELRGQPFAGEPPEFLTEDRRGYVDEYDAPPPPAPSRTGIKIFGALVGLGGLAVAGVWGFAALQSNDAKIAENAPIIAAKQGAVKEKPANPGGTEVPNLNADILQKAKEVSKEPPKLVVREEQPVDLGQAVKKDIRRVDLGQAGENGAAPVVLVPVPNAQTNAGSGSGAAGTAVMLGAAAAVVATQALPTQALPTQALPSQALPSSTPVAKPAPAIPLPTLAAPSASITQLPTPAIANAPSTGPKKVKSVSITTAEPVQIPAQAAAPKPKPVAPKPVKAAPQPAKPAQDVALKGDIPEANVETPLQIVPPAGVSRKGQKVAAVTPTAVKAPKPAKAPVEEADDAPAEAAPVVATGGGKFSVQFGAPGSTSEAQNLISKLKSKYPSVIGAAGTRVIKAQVNGKDVYRVRSGSVSREKANSICTDMKAAGGSCFISGG